MYHENLSDEINHNIAQSSIDGGVWVLPHSNHVCADIKAQPVLPVGKTLKIRTENRVYTLFKYGDTKFTISGHPVYCPEPTQCKVLGSNWGGSMLKIGFIGRGMHLEFATMKHRVVTTSRIEEITEEL